MAAPETVRVYAVDENTDPLTDVLVRVFDGTDTFITQGVTALVGAEAYTEFTVDGDDPPIPYTVRLSKAGVAFDGSLGDDSKTPQGIEVYSPASLAPTGTNNFQVQGQTFTLPVATDPRLCRASGFFVDPAGRPLADYDISFYNQACPLIVDGKAVVGSRVWGKTDANGYFELDLYRGGAYLVDMEGLVMARSIIVPDLGAVNLVSLLFPTVASISYVPDPVSLAVGGTQEVTVTVLDSTGREIALADCDVTFESSDVSIFTVSISDEVVTLTGVAAGAAELVATRMDTSIVVVPDITLDTLAVTVS